MTMEMVENTTRNLKTLKRNLSASIVGVSWKKMPTCPASEDESENDPETGESHGPPPVKKGRRRQSIGHMTDVTNQIKDDALSRVQFVRNAFGSMRQKLRSSTKRRKRLFPIPSPYRSSHGNPHTPISEEMRSPVSVCRRRSPRLCGASPDLAETVAMYSPFTIDTPNRTPRIKMGTNRPKRLGAGENSPRQFKCDMETVSEALRLLNHNASKINTLIDKQAGGSGIITTPGGRRTPNQKKQIFV